MPGKTTPELIVFDLLGSLEICAHASRLHAAAIYMLAEDLAQLNRPVSSITLGEIDVACGRVTAKYGDSPSRPGAH